MSAEDEQYSVKGGSGSICLTWVIVYVCEYVVHYIGEGWGGLKGREEREIPPNGWYKTNLNYLK